MGQSTSSTGQLSRQQQVKPQDKMKLFKMLLPLLLVATCSGFSLNALLGGSAEEQPAVEQQVEDFEEDLEEEDLQEEDEDLEEELEEDEEEEDLTALEEEDEEF